MSEENNYPVVVENLYKIFGPNPERAFDLIEQGYGKEEIFEQTGLTVGVLDANFQVREGEIFVVMGLSGSGKSTLVRMLNRLIEPTSGSVYVEGKDISKMEEDDLIKVRRQKMSMVFQSFALMSHMTVLENAAFGLEISGHEQKEREERAMRSLEQVGLKANAKSYPDELSGGMQQRVGLARGLAGDPSIMLMDEAFSALDPLIRTEMQDLLLSLQAESSRTVIFISHDLDEAMRIGDRIAMMEGGKIVQVGTPEEILKYPANDYVQAFFRGVDPTTVLRAGDIARDNQVTIIKHRGDELHPALERLQSYDRPYGYVLDEKRGFLGVVSVDSLHECIDKEKKENVNVEIEEAFLDKVEAVTEDNSLQDSLSFIADSPVPVPVVDNDNVYKGVISKNRFLRTMQREKQ